MSVPTLTEVTAANVDRHGFFCVKNKKHAGYPTKLAWLEERFREGLKILLLEEDGRQLGFLEYVPSEYAWRGVHLDGYLFIHCIFLARKPDREQGYASQLIQACIEDAGRQGKKGVAVLGSDGAWLASRAIYLKNGFEVADTHPDGYQLLVHHLGDYPLPQLSDDWEERLAPYREGFHLLYANQCPYHLQSVRAIQEVAAKHGYEVNAVELTNPADAQAAPSPYGVFNLIYNGRLIAEHYISGTRFRNILTKELGL